MYRAGSTWQYNVVSHLVEMFGMGRRIGFCNDGKSFLTHAADNPSQDEFLVLKTHDYHLEFANALTEGRALGVYIYRDLRDVAYSFTHKYLGRFEDIVAETRFLAQAIQNDEFWRSQPRVLCQRYETVIQDAVTPILELAKHLGFSLSTELAESVAREYSFAANFKRTRAVLEQCEALGLNLRDPQNALHHDDSTLFHWNHLREGRSGGWQEEATEEEIIVLLAACGDWLIRRGYESDFSWATGNRDFDRVEWAIRGLVQAHEHDSSEILKLRRKVAELNAHLELQARLGEREVLSPFLRNEALKLQGILGRHPTLRALLKFLLRRKSTAVPLPACHPEPELSCRADTVPDDPNPKRHAR
jgi:hypothetical protein